MIERRARIRITYDLLLEVLRAMTLIPVDAVAIDAGVSPGERMVDLYFCSGDLEAVPEGSWAPVFKLIPLMPSIEKEVRKVAKKKPIGGKGKGGKKC